MENKSLQGPDGLGQTESRPVETDEARCACGYWHGGRNTSGRCPECGASIPLPVIDYKLVLADPAWLRHLSFGATCCLFSFVISIFVTAVVLTGFLNPSISNTVWSWSSSLSFYLVEQVLFFIGVWWLTSTWKGEVGFLQFGIRLALIAEIALRIAPFLSVLSFATSIVAEPLADIAMRVLLLLQIRFLGQRMADSFVIQHSMILIWCSCVQILFEVAIRFTGRMHVGGNAIILSLIGFGLIIYTTVLIQRLRIALRGALNASEHLRAS